VIRYYTRACNFYYGSLSIKLVKTKKTLPIGGSKNISFDQIEIFSRKKNKIQTKIINIKEIKNLSKEIRKKIISDIKQITSKRIFLNNKSHMLMGILNMTPDSFSDGGKFNIYSKAFKRIREMINSGANIIDIGGESTRPGSKIIHPKIEWKRVEKVIKKFKKNFPKTLLSVDTRKSSVMEKAIKSKYNHVLLDIYDFFEREIKKLKEDKYHKKIILDPGIGFGKNLKHNLIILSKISIFHSLGFPILIGTSRKKFINQISKKFDTRERLGGTLSSVLFSFSQGIQIFRIHNVEEVKQGILVYKTLLNK